MTNFKIILLQTIVIFAMISCKKEDNAINSNIIVTPINSTFNLRSEDTTVYKELDIDKDGAKDFTFMMKYQYKVRLGNNNYVYMYASKIQNEVVAHHGNIEGYFLNELTTSDSISPTSTIWIPEASAATYWTQSRININEGIAGKGNSIIGFRFLIGTDLHYGWLKLNVSEDFRTINIMEAAYDKRPNTSILAGAK
jgi:hypothetical protein